MKLFRFCFLLPFVLCACNNNNSSGEGAAVTDDNNPPPPMISYSIVKVYPHDTSSYTEGLEWVNNKLYESGGNYGSSKLVQKDIDGKIDNSINLTKQYFGEGCTVLNNKIYQLTWNEHKVFVYDASTLKKTNELSWPYEGWGMTNNGKQIIISTGSSNLYFVDPNTFKILNQVTVTDNYGPVTSINELEYVDGFIYSNVYETDNILKINPETGAVVGKFDFTGLLQKSGMKYNAQNYPGSNGNVLNGIAYDSSKKAFYITGKMWPALFEVKFNG
ncbi:MAG: glutaminyl-peptide cyclotransferase [Parafilimonas sp.]|nr:glutaminyl-peptide cyclotransferase [Parafilimonas sp.]